MVFHGIIIQLCYLDLASINSNSNYVSYVHIVHAYTLYSIHAIKFGIVAKHFNIMICYVGSCISHDGDALRAHFHVSIKSTKVTRWRKFDHGKLDNKIFFREFEVGEKVLLKVAPNRSGLKLGKSRKLSPRFCGPFEIVKRIRQVYYEIKLPKDWKIHNVFYVVLLRKYVFDFNHILLDLPKATPEEKLLLNLRRFWRWRINI